MANKLEWSEMRRPDRAHGDALGNAPQHVEQRDAPPTTPQVEQRDELTGTPEPNDPEAERKKRLAAFATPAILGLAFALLIAGGLLAPLRRQAAFVLMTLALCGFALAAVVTAMVSLRTRRSGDKGARSPV